MNVNVMGEGNFLAAIGNAYIPTHVRHQLFQLPDQLRVHIAVVIGEYRVRAGALFSNNTTIFSHQPVFMFLLHNADNVSPLK